MRQDLGQAGPAQRSYTRDSDGTLLISDSATETIHGQWLNHSGGAGQGETQDYTYDGIGRLTHVADTAEGTCTRRGYGFDNRTNRTSLTTTVGTPGSDCPTTGGTTRTSAYDSADRIVDSGYVYDTFGRTTALPGGTAVTYYANDLVRRQTAATAARRGRSTRPTDSAAGRPSRVRRREPGHQCRPRRTQGLPLQQAYGLPLLGQGGPQEVDEQAQPAPHLQHHLQAQQTGLWTGRVADYGFVPAGIAGIVAMIFPHPAVIAVCAIIAEASIAIQTTFGWTHFLYFYGYAYPWRGSC